MPRSGPAHAINNTRWDGVERELKKRKWQRLDLATAVGCSPSVITALLNGNKHESPYVPEIHEALEWSPPNPPLLSEDEEELLRIYRRLENHAKERLKRIGRGLTKHPKISK